MYQLHVAHNHNMLQTLLDLLVQCMSYLLYLTVLLRCLIKDYLPCPYCED